MKRPEEAMAQMQRALELDPFNGLWKAWHAWELEIVGRYDESFDEWHKALKTSSGLQYVHGSLAFLLIRKGMYEESLAEWKAYYAGDSEIQEALTQGHSQSGYRGAVRRAAETLAARARNAYVIPIDAATLYVMAGDEAQALAWLEKGFEMRDPNMVYVNRYLEFESLHNTPRFQEIVRRMKLP
jgi:tetratricopeptide (TPR) repeat protein